MKGIAHPCFINPRRNANRTKSLSCNKLKTSRGANTWQILSFSHHRNKYVLFDSGAYNNKP